MASEASLVRPELSADDIRKTVDLSHLTFTTTADLTPQYEMMGQDRALQALKLGLEMPQNGYNIVISGLEGVGIQDPIVDRLRTHAAGQPTPGDWVYVHPFRHPDEPQKIALDAGQGGRFQHDMDQLVTQIREMLPKAFRQEAFEQEQQELSAKYERQGRQIQDTFVQMARDKGFGIQFDPRGSIAVIPNRDGEPISHDDFQSLSEAERDSWSEREREVMQQFREALKQQRQLMQQMSEDIRHIERQYSATIIDPLIAALKQRHVQTDVHHYLDEVRTHMLAHLDRFKESSQSSPEQPLALPSSNGGERFIEYQVNVVVDNADTQGAPVLVEDTPTYKNLFGAIDRAVDPHGRVVTSFTRIKAGSLLRANGGYLVFNLEDALTEPLVWKTLKRALQSNQVKIDTYDPFAFFTVSALQPEPIPIRTKVVVLARPWLYYLLYFNDPDFRQLFKIRAEFGEEMDRTLDHQANYAHFIANLCQSEHLCPLDRSAVEAVIEEGMRQAGDQDKLAAQLGSLTDLVRESNYAAVQHGATVVSRFHVEQARQAHIFRSNGIEERMREMITDGTVLIDTKGERIGAINGLSVLQLGDHTFGRPARVTATTSMGRGGIVNIEREAKLSGSTHDKGILILSGYLHQQYAQDKPLTLSASLCFEQSYSGIDGDSASSTELYALLSRLAGLPIRQDLAVTGSVNQSGEVQAIGGVNEKIEGFFDVCAEQGLTGSQGVLIPQANVRHLMLRPDVVEAVRAGQFHIYPVDHIDQGLELLTGCSAGDIHTPDSVHYDVNQRLLQLAKDMMSFGDHRDPTEKAATTLTLNQGASDFST